MPALPRVSTRLALVLAALLVFALVATQTLGVVHAITHGLFHSLPLSQHEGHDHDQDHDHAEAEANGPVANHFFASLFSLHQDESDCRLYDQASHDGGIVVATPHALPAVLPLQTVAIFQGDALARWAALFDARGPPLTV